MFLQWNIPGIYLWCCGYQVSINNDILLLLRVQLSYRELAWIIANELQKKRFSTYYQILFLISDKVTFVSYLECKLMYAVIPLFRVNILQISVVYTIVSCKNNTHDHRFSFVYLFCWWLLEASYDKNFYIPEMFGCSVGDQVASPAVRYFMSHNVC